VDLSVAYHIENNETSYDSYTFTIEREESNPFLDNLILSKQEDGSYRAMLLTYHTSLEQKEALTRGETINWEGIKADQIDLNDDVINNIGLGTKNTRFNSNLDDLIFHILNDEYATANCYLLSGGVFTPCPESIDEPSGPSSGGGSSSSGGSGFPTGGGNPPTGGGTTTTTPPIATSPITPSKLISIKLIKNLKPLTAAQQTWLDTEMQFQEQLSLYASLEKQNYSVESKNAAKKIIDILRGAANTNILTTVQEHKVFSSFTGNSLTLLNKNLFPEHSEAFSNLDPNGVLNFQDWRTISPRIENLYKTVKDFEGIKDFEDVSQLPEWLKALIVKNSLFAKILAYAKELYENYAPQNAEEWATLGTIMGTELLDAATDFIPGVGEIKDAIRAIDALNNGDYVSAAENIVFAIVGIIPVGKLLDNLVTVGKRLFRAIKIFNKITPFINQLRLLLDRGYNITLTSLERLKLTKNNRLIAQGDDVRRFALAFGTRIDDLVTDITKVNLPPSIASTFTENAYRTVKTNLPIPLNRVFGNQAKLKGGFATTKANATRDELALLDEWNNSMRFEAKINVPSGQTLNIGKVAPQTSSSGSQILSGGEDQILMPQNWNPQNWVDQVIDKTTGQTYTFQQFSDAFPNLIN